MTLEEPSPVVGMGEQLSELAGALDGSVDALAGCALDLVDRAARCTDLARRYEELAGRLEPHDLGLAGAARALAGLLRASEPLLADVSGVVERTIGAGGRVADLLGGRRGAGVR